jgi:hypothetical protein
MAIFPSTISRQALASTLVCTTSPPFTPATFKKWLLKPSHPITKPPYYTAQQHSPHPTLRGPFPLGLSMPHPDSLSFSTANCFGLDWIHWSWHRNTCNQCERASARGHHAPHPPYIYPTLTSAPSKPLPDRSAPPSLLLVPC